MPTTDFRNLVYRAALPIAPSPRRQMTHHVYGQPVDMKAYEHILRKHHVLGSSLLLSDGDSFASVYTSTQRPAHNAEQDTMFRVASITKMATALVVLKLAEEQAFSLDDDIAHLLPDAASEAALHGITIRQILCHTSGLRDTQAYEDALHKRLPFQHVLRADNIRGDNTMVYCNFGFGLLGCMIEHVTQQSLETVFQQKLFQPLAMRATLDASTLDPNDIMPISRVLLYHKGHDVIITALGRQSIAQPDPSRHFGHTAGAMYTDCASLANMLLIIRHNGAFHGQQFLSETSVHQMKTQHSYTGSASAPTRRYGLGLVILDRSDLSPHKLYGHQGFAYGCVDGAFFEEDTGRQMVFLNGGCSEAREGRLGLCNKDLLIWAMQKEIPSWK